MDAVSYPNEQLSRVMEEHVAPVRLNIMKERDLAKRFDARWTPTFVFLDAGERVHHRFIGFHPPREMAAQVQLARGHAAFAAGDVDGALAGFEAVDAPEFAPEAMYWAGVCRFKKTKDTQPIYDACRSIVKEYPNHFWATKVGFVAKYKDFNLAP